MKEVKGVILVKDGKGWGIVYEEKNHCREDGWVDIDYAVIHNAEFCKKPSDILYKGSPQISEVNKGKLMRALRVVTTVIENENSVNTEGEK